MGQSDEIGRLSLDAFVSAGHCPVHGDPEHTWPCPLAFEDDPPEVESCEHFLAELERRVANVKAGNYWRWERYDDGGHVMYEYHGGEPTGRTTQHPHHP